MAHTCARCGATFATRQKLDRHAARKRPCPQLTSGERPPLDLANPNQCRHCRNDYSRPDSLKRHLNTCAAINPARVQLQPAQKYELARQREHFEAELAKRDAALADLTSRLDQLTAMTATTTAEATEVAHDLDWIGLDKADVEFDITTLVISTDE